MILLLLITTIQPKIKAIQKEDWPTYQHDSKNTGFSSSSAPNTKNILRKYEVGETCCPLSIVDDRLLVTSTNYLRCLNISTGNELWKWKVVSGASFPSISNGMVFIGEDYEIYALNLTNGRWIWDYPIDCYADSCSPSVANGKVFVGGRNHAYCLDLATGCLVWNVTYKRSSISMGESHPAISDGKVFVACYGNQSILCLSESGKIIWEYKIGGITDSCPAVANGRVYVGTASLSDDYLYCLSVTDGDEIWKYRTNNVIRCSPAVGYGRVYFGSYDGYFYCLGENGKLIWTRKIGDDLSSYPLGSPALADQKVYITSRNHTLYCFDFKTGATIWKYPFSDWVLDPIIAKGKLFVGSGNGNIYMFGDVEQHPVKIEVELEREELSYENNETKITLKIKNSGEQPVRDIEIQLILPPHFETDNATTWSGDLGAGEETKLELNVKTKRCISGKFQIKGEYVDSNDEPVEISEEFIIYVTDWILLGHYKSHTMVNLSPETIEKCKEILGAEDTSASIWITSLIIDLNLTEVEIDTLFEHAEEFIYWLRLILEQEELDQDTLAKLADWVAGVFLNTLGLYIQANYRQDRVYTDGTLDYNALWILSAIEEVLGTIIDAFIDAIEEGMELIIDNNFVYLEDPEGKLYLRVYGSEGEEVKVYYADSKALVILEPETTNFTVTIDGREAHKDIEEYSLGYFAIRKNEIVEHKLITAAIEEGNEQLYDLQVDTSGNVIHLDTSRKFNVVWDEGIYPVVIFSNSTISNFTFNQTAFSISFNVTGEGDTTGFCNVMIPRTLLDAPEGWIVSLDSQSLTIDVSYNKTYSSIYFVYSHSTQRVYIIGTEVIPEFTENMILALLIAATFLMILLKKLRPKAAKNPFLFYLKIMYIYY